MKSRYALKTFLIFILSFTVVFGGFCTSSYIKHKKMHGESLTQFVSTPIKKLLSVRSQLLPDTRHQIRIEMQIKQKPEQSDGQIESVYFDGKKVPLSPVDQAGRRGSVFVRVPPGTHTIVWKVKNNPYIWPKTTTYKRTLVISKEQLWVYVMINGEEIDVR